MTNPWNEHVAAFRQKHPDMSFKQVLIEASKTYKKDKADVQCRTRKKKDGSSYKICYKE